MIGALRRYARWLHTGFPAGKVEPLPVVNDDFTTAIDGVFVVGDLTGVPLLKLASDSGARVVRRIAGELGSEPGRDGVLDVAIVGGGVAGMAAALEAKSLGLAFRVFEAAAPFSTIAEFPARKPIYTYPSDLDPAGALKFSARSSVKEGLLEELQDLTRGLERGVEIVTARVERVARKGSLVEVELEGGDRIAARRVIVAIGRSGEPRRLGVPGEDLPHVFHRIFDPRDHEGSRMIVVGGGDSALESAIALADSGARVTLVHRGEDLARPKAENVTRVEALARSSRLEVRLATRVTRIERDAVTLRDAAGEERREGADAVLVQIGRAAPLEFFRASGIPVRGERGVVSWLALAAVLLVAAFVYNWKAGASLTAAFRAHRLFPFDLVAAYQHANESDPAALATLALRAAIEPGFWYSLAYTLVIVVFGIRRIARRKTPYVTLQTWTLIAIQAIPLFVLPYFALPWLDRHGAFDAGIARSLADQLIPLPAGGGEREYWRAFGLILAWPLFLWNLFTDVPTTGWLVVSLVQTFVLIPLIVWRWGKGAYCGWICSCGGLAETLGDAHRHKMPHGPGWNRLNLLGQGLLAICLFLLALRVAGWAFPGSFAERAYRAILGDFAPFGIQLNYRWVVDVTLAGILGVGLYFHFSGRTWCRFACPLAALMHVYARFSRFRILADKKKCISCSVCTTVCHQGIDVMAFAARGKPLDDPQCVRCSACVSSCPTNVLSFGAIDRKTGEVLAVDRLSAMNRDAREVTSTAPRSL
jgi:NosR/NirI family nitrous oxide reductase transcriptional regulator